MTDQSPTGQLTDLLHDHFIAPKDRLSPAGAGAIYLTEVTAPGGTRRADAVHIGLWQSRGAGRIDVCELKTSRGDWLKELREPKKAEAWWPYCHRFWLVVPHEGIVKDGELPDGWGLMMPSSRGRRFRVLVKAKDRAPEDFKLTIPLLVTLLKNTETTRTNALQQLRTDMSRQAYQREQELTRAREARSLNPRTQKRLELLSLVESALGCQLDNETWTDRLSAPDAAAVLRNFVAGQKALAESRKEMERRIREFERIKESAVRATADLRAALTTTDAMERTA